MKKSIYWLYCCFVVCWIVGCQTADKSEKQQLVKTSKGDAYFGGIFNMNEEEFFRTLYPPNIGDAIGHRVANQLYEGLVRPSQASDVRILPCLASRWEVSPDGKVYTFWLRADVRFHDDACFPDGKGRLMNAQDVKYCLDRACASASDNKGSNFFKDRIAGATDYFEATKTGKYPEGGVSGIVVSNDSTLQITLTAPFPNFLYLLAMQYGFVYPKEAITKYGNDGMRLHAVGTGPFVLKNATENQSVLLLKNENYWGTDSFGNHLPYLNGIRISFVNDKMAELLNFKQGKLDMVYKLPYEMSDEIVDRSGKLLGDYSQFVLQESPTLNVQYYGFLTTGKLFNKKALRQAFCYAIDRQKLVDYTLKGAAVPAIYGRTPTCVPDFPYQQIKGYGFDPQKAKALIAEAGYPDGKGLQPIKLQINSGAKRNEQVAEVVAKMLEENLGVKIVLDKLPLSQHFELVEQGKTDFWRSGWMGDYPDAENFLHFLLSKHVPTEANGIAYLNPMRYKNPVFDAKVAQALATTNTTQRNLLYVAAEQIALDDAPTMNLFYEKDRRLLQVYVQNFPQNMLEYRNLVDVYLMPH
ncbi:MAG: ABC transporter substrate-binding protein [Chitinophagales bacterium]|nr:ABC transporter substrate-binding protein [Chitinophagales bacterium]